MPSSTTITVRCLGRAFGRTLRRTVLLSRDLGHLQPSLAFQPCGAGLADKVAVAVEMDVAALVHGADRQFGAVGCAQFPAEHHVQFGAEGLGHLQAHLEPAAWNRQHERFDHGNRLQALGQTKTRFGSIRKG